MFQVEAEIHGDIQQRTWFAVILIGQLTGFEFKCFVGGQEGNFGQNTIVADYRVQGPVGSRIESPVELFARYKTWYSSIIGKF